MDVPLGHIDLLGTDNTTSQLLPGMKYTSATRTNIVDTLLSLSTNPQIQYGDNILIYFAGHSTVYHCKDHSAYNFPADQGTIEALCPVDRSPIVSDKDKLISATESSVPVEDMVLQPLGPTAMPSFILHYFDFRIDHYHFLASYPHHLCICPRIYVC